LGEISPFQRIFMSMGAFFLKNIAQIIWAHFFQKMARNSPKEVLDFGYFLSLNSQVLTGNLFGQTFLQNWALFFKKRLVAIDPSKNLKNVGSETTADVRSIRMN
jgi:hypothetical protein